MHKHGVWENAQILYMLLQCERQNAFMVKLQNKRVTEVIKTCFSIAFNEKKQQQREKLVISIIHYLPWRNDAAFRSSLELTSRILIWAYKRRMNGEGNLKLTQSNATRAIKCDGGGGHL